MSETVAPLKIGRFRSLWLASIFSNLGSFFQSVAAGWLMLELTGSATWVGLMAAANTLPLLFLALLAGAVADLVDRTRVMIAAQLLMGGSAAAMAALTWAELITPGRLLGLGLLMGVGMAFNLPAWQAMVPDLVPKGMVASAVALNSIAFNVARAVGPALGGAIVAAWGPEAGFGINALSFIGVILVVAGLAAAAGHPERDATPVSTAIGLGIRYARYTRPFRRLLALAAMFAITSSVIQAVLPNRTEEVGGDEVTYGLLLGAMGAGALVGGLTRGALTARLGRHSVPTTVTLFGISGVAAGLAPTGWAMLVPLAAAGACWVWTLTTLNATAQLMSPEWVRGRAMSLYSLAFVGITPLGAILGGSIADLTGPGRATALLSAAGVALGVAARRFGLPWIEEIHVPEFTGEPSAAGHAATDGGPVMVLNTWSVARRDLEQFLEVMTEVRFVRLRTGAYRWRLYRDTDDPHTLTEVFLTVSWQEHLAQHRRIDDESRTLIGRARAFDQTGGPTTRHLVAVDVERTEDWESLVSAHEMFHATDGSIPLGREVGTGSPSGSPP